MLWRPCLVCRLPMAACQRVHWLATARHGRAHVAHTVLPHGAYHARRRKDEDIGRQRHAAGAVNSGARAGDEPGHAAPGRQSAGHHAELRQQGIYALRCHRAGQPESAQYSGPQSGIAHHFTPAQPGSEIHALSIGGLGSFVKGEEHTGDVSARLLRRYP